MENFSVFQVGQRIRGSRESTAESPPARADERGGVWAADAHPESEGVSEVISPGDGDRSLAGRLGGADRSPLRERTFAPVFLRPLFPGAVSPPLSFETVDLTTRSEPSLLPAGGAAPILRDREAHSPKGVIAVSATRRSPRQVFCLADGGAVVRRDRRAVPKSSLGRPRNSFRRAQVARKISSHNPGGDRRSPRSPPGHKQDRRLPPRSPLSPGKGALQQIIRATLRLPHASPWGRPHSRATRSDQYIEVASSPAGHSPPWSQSGPLCQRQRRQRVRAHKPAPGHNSVARTVTRTSYERGLSEERGTGRRLFSEAHKDRALPTSASSRCPKLERDRGGRPEAGGWSA
ncbi:hypothetical protein THAOC_33397 [Thalassiosira oceanica]|uniref:Uncharacterized protein n=1 Tax=Thalassiosira oceanica TaxID=159749 RepID=K0RMA2_THAOC|nr:hypothetical protein THAOC_33397 [Thalassiosira oceanica]|eukprot:EJK47857.1 hypothetical protein THAOC_33397 [Thalassiosira oceanica]